MAPPSIPLLFHKYVKPLPATKKKLRLRERGKEVSIFVLRGALKVQPIAMTVKKMFSLLY
jgi:hypothetical protein